jgi:hypothetical protein
MVSSESTINGDTMQNVELEDGMAFAMVEEGLGLERYAFSVALVVPDFRTAGRVDVMR